MTTIYPPRALIEADRPPRAASLLSRSYRDRLIERAFLGLYRWYTSRSQETRNWNPDTSFEWTKARTDHSTDVQQVLEGFFAVEQYVPDYTSTLLNVIRRSHGRSHFHIRWGSEEEKHADTWENAVLFTKSRTPQELAEYKYQLRKKEWELPWDDPLHMLCYTVFQERATQLNYLNMGKIATGQHPKINEPDPVLARVSHTIAIDEAAHYNFFLEGMRLYLYYYPLETLEAIKDVLDHFSMPAALVMPNWNEFYEAAYRTGIYGPREYARDVVAFAFKAVGIPGKKALEEGIRRSRLIPDEDGQMRCSAIWESFDPAQIETDTERLYAKIQGHEAKFGMDQIDPTVFEPNPIWPSKKPVES